MSKKPVIIEEVKVVDENYENAVNGIIDCVQTMMQSTTNQRAMIYLAARFLSVFANQKSYLDYLRDKAADAIKHNDKYAIRAVKVQVENSIDCLAFDHYWQSFADMYDNYVKLTAQESTNEDGIYLTYKTSSEILDSAKKYYVDNEEDAIKEETKTLQFMLSI